jgi:hypothetical protein
VNAATVKQWVRAGRLRTRRFGGQVYIAAVDIDALLHHDTEGRKVAS